MQFGSFHLDPNIFIFAVVGGFFGLTFLFGEARLKRISLGLLAGLFAADQRTNFILTQLAHGGTKSIEESTIKLVLLLVVLVILSLGKAPSVGGHFSLRSMILSLLTAATLIAYVLGYFSLGEQTRILNDYNLAAIAVNNRSWWLAGLILWLLITQLWKKKAKEDAVPTGKGKKGKKKR